MRITANTRSQRQRIRTILREAFGDRCYWCGKIMKFAVLNKHHHDMDEMATIEHKIAKEKGDYNLVFYMRLAHKRCNQ